MAGTRDGFALAEVDLEQRREGDVLGSSQSGRRSSLRLLRVLDDAGRVGVPFTTGLLIGIGETLAERVDALFAIRRTHREYGHLQEVIVQNFRAKPDTAMRGMPDAELHDLAAPQVDGRVEVHQTETGAAQRSTNACRAARPVRLDFSGWNWVAHTEPCATEATTGPP